MKMEYRIIEKYFQWHDHNTGYYVECRPLGFFKFLGWRFFGFHPEGSGDSVHHSKKEAEDFIRKCMDYKKEPIIHEVDTNKLSPPLSTSSNKIMDFFSKDNS